MTNIFNVGGARIGVQVLPNPTDTPSTVHLQVYTITQAFPVGALLLGLVPFHAGFNICL